MEFVEYYKDCYPSGSNSNIDVKIKLREIFLFYGSRGKGSDGKIERGTEKGDHMRLKQLLGEIRTFECSYLNEVLQQENRINTAVIRMNFSETRTKVL